MRKFYYFYEEDTKEYAIIEYDGGIEHGQTYDVTHFWVSSKQDAKDSVDLLNNLAYEKDTINKKAQEK